MHINFLPAEIQHAHLLFVLVRALPTIERATEMYKLSVARKRLTVSAIIGFVLTCCAHVLAIPLSRNLVVVRRVAQNREHIVGHGLGESPAKKFHVV